MTGDHASSCIDCKGNSAMRWNLREELSVQQILRCKLDLYECNLVGNRM